MNDRIDIRAIHTDMKIITALLNGLYETIADRVYSMSGRRKADQLNKKFEYWREKAEQGDADAQTSLALMYHQGEGVPKDEVKSVEWYRKAAEQGDESGQFCLGLSYADGEGVPKDGVKAVEWFRKAAEQGNTAAQSCLAEMYAKRQDVPRDLVKAYMYYNLASVTDSETCTLSGTNSDPGKMRDELAKEMTPDQIAEAQRLTSEWKPTVQPK